MATPDDTPTGPGAQDLPHGDEPGASSTPLADGEGTIGLGDRLGDAAPDTNQARSEPMPPTPGHSDPDGTGPHTDPPGVPDLGAMSAGRAPAHIPSPAGLPPRGAPEPDAAQGGDSIVLGGAGTSPRAPGRQGTTPAGESTGTDMDAGAARTATMSGTALPGAASPGDAHGVAVASRTAAAGTSEQQPPVSGVEDRTG